MYYFEQGEARRRRMYREQTKPCQSWRRNRFSLQSGIYHNSITRLERETTESLKETHSCRRNGYAPKGNEGLCSAR